jgi:4-hydroxy-3-polyprenylbenzoate decarboxylase
VRLLERLRVRNEVEVHLILTRSGEKTVFLETGRSAADLKRSADFAYPVEDIAAPLASGSFPTDAMVIAPCSVHTMSAIATGITDNLLTRAADVVLKERRRLVLMVRETPFNLAHLRNMTAVTEMGGIVFPPLPAFYHRPGSIDELVSESVERVLSLLGVAGASPKAWEGLRD